MNDMRLQEQVKALKQENARLQESVNAFSHIARFIINNKRNFTAGDFDGVAGRTIDELKKVLAVTEQSR